MERVDGYSYYFVKSCELKITRTGNPYGALSLCDVNGSTLVVSCWGLTESSTGMLVSIPYPLHVASNGFISFPVEDGEFFEVSKDYVQQYFPEFASEFPDLVSKTEFLRVLDSCFGPIYYRPSSPYYAVVSAIRSHIDSELYDRYAHAPAAKTMHHAYDGGLLTHTYEMLSMFSGLASSPVFCRLNRVLCAAGILYHDYGKLFEYSGKDHDPTEMMYLYPHSVYGAEFVKEKYSSMLSTDDMLLLQHIIVSHHGRKEWGATCEPATLSAEVVHHLDMLSSRADMFLHAENMGSVQGMSGRRVITKDILPDVDVEM